MVHECWVGGAHGEENGVTALGSVCLECRGESGKVAVIQMGTCLVTSGLCEATLSPEPGFSRDKALRQNYSLCL